LGLYHPFIHFYKIALAVYVENGYWGSRWAGRIAGLMIEKYIKGKITRKDMERYVLNGSLEDEYAKPYSGESFWINDKGEFQEITIPVVDEAN